MGNGNMIPGVGSAAFATSHCLLLSPVIATLCNREIKAHSFK